MYTVNIHVKVNVTFVESNIVATETTERIDCSRTI